MRIKKSYISFLLFLFVFIFGVYFFNASAFGKSTDSVFSEGTIINGIDCSNLTVDEAEDKLTEKWNNNKFEIIEADDKEVNTIPKLWNMKDILTQRQQAQKFYEEEILFTNEDAKIYGTIANLDLTYDIKDELNDILNQNGFIKFLKKIHLLDNDERIIMKVSKTSKSFDNQLSELDIYNLSGKVIKTKNAYIDLDSANFDIKKEVYGNNIDKDLLESEILNFIEQGKFSMNFVAEDFYVKPTVLSTDKELLDRQEYLRNLDIPSITYKMYTGTVEVKKSDILKMYGISEDKLFEDFSLDTLTVDEENVNEFVRELAKKYDSAWSDHEFKSTLQGTITVSGGDYGYLIDEDKEALKLISELKEKKDINRKPVYSQVGYNGAKDIGDSYVEIDITNQTLWLYKDGKLIITFPVVTGNIYMGYGTPPGVYILKSKSMYVTLEGENADGSKYASPVTYWLPFNGGIGMHDANWRGSFGGSIYMGNGSHGCVNMPPSKAGTVYDNVEVGYPIVVHY